MTLFEEPQKINNRMKLLFIRLLPFMASTAAFKMLIWYFEYKGYFVNPEIDGMLTILGIVIGIILATQLPFAVSKYKEANDNLDNTRAILWSISNMFIREKVSKEDRKIFVDITRDWLESYRGYLKDRNSKKIMIKKFRVFSLSFGPIFKKYKFSESRKSRVDEWLCLISRFMSGEDSLKSMRTPDAYYDIMRIGIFIYIIGSALGYPGLVGLLITISIAFFFGGMYVLAADFDDPFGYSRDEIVDVDIDTPISDAQYYIADDF